MNRTLAVVVFMCAEEEMKEENMDVVMAREKRSTWHTNFAHGT